jgi:hypothetical protein
MLTDGRKWGALLVIAGIALSLTGCHTEYHGADSGIDGTLWRQISAFEDPLSLSLYQSSAAQPVAYLESLQGERWSGSVASASNLDMAKGGVVLYDISSTESSAELSVFIASGPRPDILTDEGRDYNGPVQVFTCYRVEANFSHTPCCLMAARRPSSNCCQKAQPSPAVRFSTAERPSESTSRRNSKCLVTFVPPNPWDMRPKESPATRRATT